jgi:beta-N-acetylhexosaminidase
LTTNAAQLVWRGFDGTVLPTWLSRLVEAGRCSGLVLFARNVEHPAQVHALAASAQRAAGGVPFPVAVDQEGGRVQRLREPHFTRFPAARVAAELGADHVREVGRAMGEELRAAGVNLDFAPVADVQSGVGGVIGDRSFGGDPHTVTRAALAWLEGLEGASVAGCAKHFPGHGDASCDSHEDLPAAHEDDARHLPPFGALVEAGVRSVMVGHLLARSVDAERPATLSARWVGERLRRACGFGGVVFTDDLEMGAITRRWPVDEAAVLAVEAGCDALLVCTRRESQDAAAEALVREAERSAAFARRVRRSAERIGRLRATLSGPAAAFDPSALRTAEHLRLAGLRGE